ncbi:MAG TPA: alpha/beta hydrolase-fold protein [Planctomycetota bacterium]|nr:alpha/beta hydrolase-fold protein [Planctomycetota bacterium]
MPPRGRVVLLPVRSRVLRGNPLGDPFVRELPVYLPPGYDGRRRFPVLYCLAGFTGTGRALLNDQAWAPGLATRMDALLAARRARPSILAAPDCFTRLGGSQYLNSTALGRYEEHLVEELVPLVDQAFRTLPAREHRGVLGKSSGGYGAIRLGMRRSDLFGGVACHSGDMAFEYCYLPDFPKALAGLEKHGGVAGFLRAFERAPRKTGELLAVLNILAMAAAYSPNPKARPLRIDLPFSEKTGELRGEVWARWLENDPVRMVEGYADSLKALRVLYFDCGSRDEYNLHLGARILAGRLSRGRVRHVHQEFEDGHMSIVYRYDVSLPLLTRVLAR